MVAVMITREGETRVHNNSKFVLMLRVEIYKHLFV